MRAATKRILRKLLASDPPHWAICLRSPSRRGRRRYHSHGSHIQSPDSNYFETNGFEPHSTRRHSLLSTTARTPAAKPCRGVHRAKAAEPKSEPFRVPRQINDDRFGTNMKKLNKLITKMNLFSPTTMRKELLMQIWPVLSTQKQTSVRLALSKRGCRATRSSCSFLEQK